MEFSGVRTGEVATGCVSHSLGDGHDPGDAHATLLVFHPEATLLSNLFILSLLLLATILCLLGAHTEGKETRPLWLLLGAGFLLATVGQLGWTYSAFAAHLHIRNAGLQLRLLLFRLRNSDPAGHLLQG